MTGDYQIALQEGSTMVRIGTALFGYEKRRINLVIPTGSNGNFVDPDHNQSAAGECDTFSFKWGFCRSGSDAFPVEAGVHKCFKYLHRLFPAAMNLAGKQQMLALLCWRAKRAISGFQHKAPLIPVCLFTVMVIPLSTAADGYSTLHFALFKGFSQRMCKIAVITTVG